MWSRRAVAVAVALCCGTSVAGYAGFMQSGINAAKTSYVNGTALPMTHVQRIWAQTSNGAVRFSAVVTPDGSTVFVGNADGQVYGLKMPQAMGAARWPVRIALGYDPVSIGMSLQLMTVPTGPPALDEHGRFFFGAQDGHIYCYAVSNSTLLWKFNAQGPIASGITYSTGMIFFGTDGGAVFSLVAATGAVNWESPTQGKVSGAPAFDPNTGTTYVTSWDTNVYALMPSGYQLWSASPSPGSLITTSPVWDAVHQQVIVTVSATQGSPGGMYAITNNPMTGNSDVRTLHSGPFTTSVSPVLLPNGHAIYGNTVGDVYCIDARPSANATIIWKASLGSGIMGNPIADDKVVVFSTNAGVVYGYSVTDGTQLWSQNLNSGVITAGVAVLPSGDMVVGSNAGTIFSIGGSDWQGWAGIAVFSVLGVVGLFSLCIGYRCFELSAVIVCICTVGAGSLIITTAFVHLPALAHAGIALVVAALATTVGLIWRPVAVWLFGILFVLCALRDTLKVMLWRFHDLVGNKLWIVVASAAFLVLLVSAFTGAKRMRKFVSLLGVSALAASALTDAIFFFYPLYVSQMVPLVPAYAGVFLISMCFNGLVTGRKQHHLTRKQMQELEKQQQQAAGAGATGDSMSQPLLDPSEIPVQVAPDHVLNLRYSGRGGDPNLVGGPLAGGLGYQAYGTGGPVSYYPVPQTDVSPTYVAQFAYGKLGLRLEQSPSRVPSSAAVAEVYGQALQQGVQAGDHVIRVNGRDVRDFPYQELCSFVATADRPLSIEFQRSSNIMPPSAPSDYDLPEYSDV